MYTRSTAQRRSRLNDAAQTHRAAMSHDDRDAFAEGAFYFGALCCLAAIAALLLAALAVVGSCR